MGALNFGGAMEQLARGYSSVVELSTADRMDSGLSLIHISEPTRLLSTSYAVFCLKKKMKKNGEIWVL